MTTFGQNLFLLRNSGGPAAGLPQAPVALSPLLGLDLGGAQAPHSPVTFDSMFMDIVNRSELSGPVR